MLARNTMRANQWRIKSDVDEMMAKCRRYIAHDSVE